MGWRSGFRIGVGVEVGFRNIGLSRDSGIEVESQNWEFGTGFRVGVQDRGRPSGLSFGTGVVSGFRTLVEIQDWDQEGTWIEVRLWTVLGRV